jgi:hypothetical protein
MIFFCDYFFVKPTLGFGTFFAKSIAFSLADSSFAPFLTLFVDDLSTLSVMANSFDY